MPQILFIIGKDYGINLKFIHVAFSSDLQQRGILQLFLSKTENPQKNSNQN